MTKPVSDLDHQRPRRMIGRRLQGWLRCPLCVPPGKLRRVGPYRPHRDRVRGTTGLTARWECQRCGLRFSVAVEEVARARQRLPLDELQMKAAQHTEVLASVEPTDPPDLRRAKWQYYREWRRRVGSELERVGELG